MRSEIKTPAWILFSALAVACSGAPRSTPPEAATVTQQQQAPQTRVATTASPGEVDPKLIKAGYSVMRRHGEVYYCRNEIITGQRIASRICLTAGQVQDEQQNVTKAKDMMNQPSYQCVGASCSN
jgi:hypothetical protein